MAEKENRHKIDVSKISPQEAPHPVNYAVPNFGVD